MCCVSVTDPLKVFLLLPWSTQHFFFTFILDSCEEFVLKERNKQNNDNDRKKSVVKQQQDDEAAVDDDSEEKNSRTNGRLEQIITLNGDNSIDSNEAELVNYNNVTSHDLTQHLLRNNNLRKSNNQIRPGVLRKSGPTKNSFLTGLDFNAMSVASLYDKDDETKEMDMERYVFKVTFIKNVFYFQWFPFSLVLVCYRFI